jgi:hypothetical protein
MAISEANTPRQAGQASEGGRGRGRRRRRSEAQGGCQTTPARLAKSNNAESRIS